MKTHHFPVTNRRAPSSDSLVRTEDEETLVTDSRASLTPSQLVEQKLIGMLNTSSILVSQVQRKMKPGPR